MDAGEFLNTSERSRWARRRPRTTSARLESEPQFCKYHPRRVDAGSSEAFEVVLACRCDLGRRGPNATEFRANVQAGRSLAPVGTDGRHGQDYHLSIESGLEFPQHLARRVHDLFDPQ